MNCKSIFVFLLLSLVTNIVFCQYSFSPPCHQPGKRAVAVARFPNYAGFSLNDDVTNNMSKMLKALMRQIIIEEPLLTHCDFKDVLKKIIRTNNLVSQFNPEKAQNTDY